MKLKSTIKLISAAAAVFFISCVSGDPLVPDKEKYIILDSKNSVIPARIQFSKDRLYHFRVAFDTGYLPDDSLRVFSFFTSGADSVWMALYDDGVTDDSLRNDIAASNNVWSGGINALDFPFEGEWLLNVYTELSGISLESFDPFTGIMVRNNTAPVITGLSGIAEYDTLQSGFQPISITLSISDPDNDASGYNDNQSLKLEIRNRDNIPKDYEFVRTNPLSNMIIQLDSTLASGLKTNNRYKFTFIATDLYGEADSLALDYIRIENNPPVIVSVEHPDTINTAEQGVFWIKSLINDPQGHLSYQDIDKVEIELNSDFYSLLDDGEFAVSGDEIENDGIYTIGFSYNSGNSGTFGFTIKAYDKAGNISMAYDSSITLSPDKSQSSTGKINEIRYNYSNPFIAD